MRRLGITLRLLGLAAVLLSGSAQASVVFCGTPEFGVRFTAVDPALPNGYCYTQSGNLQNADIAALGLTLIEKDTWSDSFSVGNNLGDLRETVDSAARTSGTWDINESLWDTWDQLYLGFHFGNGGGNPDSFIVELSRPDSTGSWQLFASGLARVNGLSNIYLIGNGQCTDDCSPPPTSVPEPGSLALVGLALVGAAGWRRRRA